MSLRFVVLAAPRTGSNLLCTLLDSHPDVLCHHEIFNPDGVFYATSLRGRFQLGSCTERDADPLEFLDRVWKAELGRAAVGFKMTRGQAAVVMDAVVGDAGVKKIVLRRRNAVKTYVSERIAQQTGCWEAYSNAELPARTPRIRVDPRALSEHVEMNARFYAVLERAMTATGQGWHGLDYEDVFDGGCQRGLLDWLGVSVDVELRPASVKQNDRDLRQLIDNYQELSGALAGTDLAPALLDRTT